MKLTNEKPTRPGYYWYASPSKPPEMVEVKDFGEGRLTVRAQSWFGETVERCQGRFSRRIPDADDNETATVQVRIALGINSKGEWNSCGWSDAKDDKDMTGIVFDTLDCADAECLHWIVADVPIPQSTTIPAEVSSAE